MHLFPINLFKLNITLHVSNRQVHHQEALSVLAAYSISHESTVCLAANTIRLPSSSRIVLASRHPIDS